MRMRVGVRSGVSIRDVASGVSGVNVGSMGANVSTHMAAKMQIVRANVEVVSDAEDRGDEQKAAGEEHTEEEDQ